MKKGIFDWFTFYSLARKRSFFAVAAVVVGFALLAGLSYTILDTSVTVSSTISLVNNLQTDGSLQAEKDKNDISESIARNSVALIQSDNVLKQAMDLSKITKSVSDFSKGVKVSRVDESNVIEITVTYNDPTRAANAANNLAQVACEEIQRRNTSPPVTATVLDRADTPSSKGKLISAVKKGFFGGVLGLICFLAVIFFLAIKDYTIRNFRLFCKTAKVDLLGILPAGQRPTSRQISESIRNVRAAFRAQIGDGKRVLLCSVDVQEGRAVVASGLANALADSGNKVLLIDADMRTSHIRSRLRVDSVYGLADVLLGKCSIADAIVPSTDYLDVICAATTYVEKPSDLLDCPVTLEMLEILSRRYDYILIDAPSVNSYGDAAALANKCDCSILVARYGKTRVDAALDALTVLKNTSARMLGIVANDVPSQYLPKQSSAKDD